MIAEVVSVGTELLLGQTTDTNAVFLAQTLSSLGIDVYYRTTVGDNPDRMRATIDQALSRADIVITIGGLGPTMDDLTKEISCAALGIELTPDPVIEQRLRDFAARRGAKLPDSFLKQALVPKTHGYPLPNLNGTAPGNLIEKNGKTIICLPGPPNEFIPMVEESVAQYVTARAGQLKTVIKSRVLRVIGVGESIAEDTVKDLMLSSNPTVAPYAKLGECHLRITARAHDDVEAFALIAPIETEIRKRLGDAIYGVDNETLEFAVVKLLTDSGKHIATAESCTGGLVAQRITSVPGSSYVFRMGVVSYANIVKQKLLNVSDEMLKISGAVSPEVAVQMAIGIKTLDAADYGVGITGIAGPSGGTPEKPVGLVYIAVSGPQAGRIEKYNFVGNRSDVQRRSAQVALALIREMLLQDGSFSNVSSISSGIFKSV